MIKIGGVNERNPKKTNNFFNRKIYLSKTVWEVRQNLRRGTIWYNFKILLNWCEF